jgi:hypothetical protein
LILFLALLFILGNLLVALGVLPSITILALAIINLVGWFLACFLGEVPWTWPWRRSA